jgi:hypothetical protein
MLLRAARMLVKSVPDAIKNLKYNLRSDVRAWKSEVRRRKNVRRLLIAEWSERFPVRSAVGRLMMFVGEFGQNVSTSLVGLSVVALAGSLVLGAALLDKEHPFALALKCLVWLVLSVVARLVAKRILLYGKNLALPPNLPEDPPPPV